MLKRVDLYYPGTGSTKSQQQKNSASIIKKTHRFYNSLNIVVYHPVNCVDGNTKCKFTEIQKLCCNMVQYAIKHRVCGKIILNKEVLEEKKWKGA